MKIHNILVLETIVSIDVAVVDDVAADDVVVVLCQGIDLTC